MWRCRLWIRKCKGYGNYYAPLQYGYIWTARCSKIFDNTETYPAESVKNIWVQLVHTLKEQFDEIKGEIEVAILKGLAFINYWKKGPFCIIQKGDLKWFFKPPSWPFPPPIT